MSDPDPKTAAVTVRPLESQAELRATVDLYRSVFELAPTDPATGPRLLAALQLNGGSVIGAFDGDRLVGFAYGFLGKDRTTGEIYHYSQTAAVASDAQGRGVGRALKLGQRQYVLSTGVTRMRWSFDPVRAGNAHFNLDVLGARARWFVRNLYGIDDMGRDVGHTSDRLIVDWDLLDPAPRVPIPSSTLGSAPPWGETCQVGTDLLISVPRHWSAVARDRDRAVALRGAVSDAIDAAMAEGMVASACRVVDDETAVYLLRPKGAE